MKKIGFITLITLLSGCSLLPQKQISGVYQGDLPCADCEKISAKLTLNADKTYQYDTVYFKNSKSFAYSDKGTFEWDKNKANVIRLDKQSGNLALQVAENYVEICDADGNPTHSNNNYKLQKISQK